MNRDGTAASALSATVPAAILTSTHFGHPSWLPRFEQSLHLSKLISDRTFLLSLYYHAKYLPNQYPRSRDRYLRKLFCFASSRLSLYTIMQ